MKAELGDKTFVILMILTLGWSNPSWVYYNKTPIDESMSTKYKYEFFAPIPSYRVYKDGRTEIYPRRTNVWPGRFFILATVGTTWMSLSGKLVASQARVCTSAIILVYVLLQYAFRIMSAYFSIVTKLEAEYEYHRGKESQTKDSHVQEWASREIQTSRDFNEAHMSSVFNAYQQMANDSRPDLSEPNAKLFRDWDAQSIQTSNDQKSEASS